MGRFDKIKEPVFLKETSTAAGQLSALEALLPDAAPEMKQRLEKDISLVKSGIVGEERIAFELRNSHIPMIILHDLYLTRGDLSAQIDYLIITRQRRFVIECKNLFGSITIDNTGSFIRTLQLRGRSYQEGIYSPITQNQRHLELIKALRGDTKKNPLMRAMFEKYFSENWRSVVVLANPQTVLNARYASKDIRQQVIRADQLIEFIKRVNAEDGAVSMSERDMEEMAQWFLAQNKENLTDYTRKYAQTPRDAEPVISAPAAAEPLAAAAAASEAPAAVQRADVILCPRCGAPMVRRKAAKGPNAGREFYGCSNFPKCRGIVNIN